VLPDTLALATEIPTRSADLNGPACDRGRAVSRCPDLAPFYTGPLTPTRKPWPRPQRPSATASGGMPSHPAYEDDDRARHRRTRTTRPRADLPGRSRRPCPTLVHECRRATLHFDIYGWQPNHTAPARPPKGCVGQGARAASEAFTKDLRAFLSAEPGRRLPFDGTPR